MKHEIPRKPFVASERRAKPIVARVNRRIDRYTTGGIRKTPRSRRLRLATKSAARGLLQDFKEAHLYGRRMSFFSKGTGKKQIYKFSFGNYRRLSPKDVYRPIEVQVTLYFGRRTEVDSVRFGEWLFRVEPCQAAKRPLSRLINQMRILSHGNVCS